MADINVGAISEALNNKADRDLNNTDVQTRLDNKANTTYVNEQLATKAKTDLSNIPSAYDYVVQTYRSGSTWYRKYKSGWVEQGGQIASSVATSTSQTVSLPIKMADTNYVAFGNTTYTGNDAPNYGSVVKSRTTTTITIGHLNGHYTTWQVSGMAA